MRYFPPMNVCRIRHVQKRTQFYALPRWVDSQSSAAILTHMRIFYYSEKPCRAMCDIQDDLSSIPDASLLLVGLHHQSAESPSKIAHHEYLPASRGHDPPAVHHGPAAEDPCNTIMQRYLPEKPSCVYVTASASAVLVS